MSMDESDVLVGEESEESDDGSSIDDSSDDEIEISEADLKDLMDIEAKLDANALDYDAHIQVS